MARNCGKFSLLYYHRFAEVLADFGQSFRVPVESHCLDHGVSSLLRVVALENSGPDEAAVNTELHQHRDVGRRRWNNEKNTSTF